METEQRPCEGHRFCPACGRPLAHADGPQPAASPVRSRWLEREQEQRDRDDLIVEVLGSRGPMTTRELSMAIGMYNGESVLARLEREGRVAQVHPRQGRYKRWGPAT